MAKNECLMIFEEILPVTKRMTDAQFGTLIRAVMAYRFQGESYRGDDAAIDIAFQFMCSQVDRTEETRARKMKAAQSRWNAKQMHSHADPVQGDAPIQSDPIQSDPIQSEPIQSQNDFIFHSLPAGAAEKKRFGKFGWVKLSDSEYDELERELGKQELERCIQYVDASAQANGNRNDWMDFSVVLRKCARQGWGLRPQKRKQDIPKGASGVLGAAEMRNIQRAMEEDYAAAPGN